ncbi:hypothetical protein H6G62_03310 [Phormidium sp. FACHB-1136]|nr:hypothetical protein [Phormidium sp. FACHB-1136]
MQLKPRDIAIQNSTLKVLIQELGQECERVMELISQLQLSNLQEDQKIEILSGLIVSSIHLSSHCDEAFQGLLADEIDHLSEI